MPAHNGVGLHEQQGAAPVSPRVGGADPEESVSGAKVRTFAGARQSGQLLTQCQIFKRHGSVSAA
jgi:hypothetical protein